MEADAKDEGNDQAEDKMEGNAKNDAAGKDGGPAVPSRGVCFGQFSGVQRCGSSRGGRWQRHGVFTLVRPLLLTKTIRGGRWIIDVGL